MGQILAFTRQAPAWPGLVAQLDPAPTWLLLNGLRPWVAAVRQKEDPLPAVLATLEAAGGAATLALSTHALMHGIAVQATRVVDVGCPHCSHVSDDEALILHAVTQAALGAEDPSLVLSSFVREAALIFLDPPLIGLAGRMREEGWQFRRRRAPMALH
ncbi:hypothetical protein KPL78_23375 [Roseomonas sp. HJA6]|uniref:Uncharacterized protein n=1 Tax=Roseomonas alba TaxID=2846776 RepID=A0ABS7AET3_9PROT|nr:hypothetical protein [Neoroseomonas alba]MBW6400822.1 hypothetical protein [Neoroseomonas alba]